MRYNLADFGRFVAGLKIADGSPLELQPFQRQLLRDHFNGTRELVILVPKKNGKTTLLAALALFHLRVVNEAEVIIVAASREQAGVLFEQAVGFIRRSDLENIYAVRPGYREIRLHGPEGPRQKTAGAGSSGSRIRVLAADADTADGVIPTLALVDELHRHRSSDLYDILRFGLTPRQGQMITISAAGTRTDSPLGRLRETALELPTVERRGVRVVAANEARSFVLREFSLRPEDDHTDIRLVKRANPAPWHTPETLREECESPSTTPGQWMRYVCGIWTEGDEPAITGAEWDRLCADIAQIQDGDEVVLAPSVGHNAAIGIASLRSDERVAVRAEIVEAREGRSILADTEDRIVELCDRYSVLEVRHPVGTFLRSADLLAARGVPLIEDPHSPARLTAATGTFDRLLRSELLMHDGDPELRSGVLAAQRKVSETGERYMISERSRAQIAVMMAVHAASAPYDDDWNIILPSGVG